MRTTRNIIAAIAAGILLLPPVVFGAPAVGTVTTSQTGSASSLTFAHDATGATCVVVGVGAGSDPTGVTYGGVSATKEVLLNQSGAYSSSLWYLDTPATGSNNVVVSLGSASPIAAYAVNLTGVDCASGPVSSSTQAGGLAGGWNASTIDLTPTTSSSISFDVLTVDGGPTSFTPGANQTSTANYLDTGSDKKVAGSYELSSSTSTVTMSWGWSTVSARFSFVGMTLTGTAESVSARQIRGVGVTR